MSRSLRVPGPLSKARARAPHMDVWSRASKRARMFILEISWRLVCGQPCGARPYMKGNVGFECRSANRRVAHELSEWMKKLEARHMQGVKCSYDIV